MSQTEEIKEEVLKREFSKSQSNMTNTNRPVKQSTKSEKRISVDGGSGERKQKSFVDLFGLNEPTVATFLLPSRGLPYGGFPKEVEMRPLITKEEKLVASINRKNYNKVIGKIFRSVIKGPEGIDIDELTQSDLATLLVWLRNISYGKSYVVQVNCPSCGNKVQKRFELDKMEVKALDKDYSEPYIVSLPDSGLKMSLRQMRRKDELFIDEYISKRESFNVISDNARWVYRYSISIVSIIDKNGNEYDDIDFEEKSKICEALSVKDFNVIKRFHLVDTDHGISMTAPFECQISECGFEDKEFKIPIDIEFFLPTHS